MNLDPQAANAVPGSQSTNQDVANNDIDAVDASIGSMRHERWTKLPKPRGRQPKDPHAQSIRFQCHEIQDLERQLQQYLQAPTAPAKHATLEFSFSMSSAFSVYTADIRNKRNTQQDEKGQHLYGKLDKSAISVIDALAQKLDPKDQMRRQKAIAKVCVEACEKADGFRYSFHNNWLSREDEACRFSYFCNDSTLNKGRAANEGVNTIGKKMRKAVYDCQGLIAVKFSHTKQKLEVHYKHIPLHETYAERAPLPRKDSKRYKLMEIFEPEKLPVESAKRGRNQTPTEPSVNSRPRKRRATGTPADEDSTQEVRYLYGAHQDRSVEPPTSTPTAVGRHAQPELKRVRKGGERQGNPARASSSIPADMSLCSPTDRPTVPVQQKAHNPATDSDFSHEGLVWMSSTQPAPIPQTQMQSQQTASHRTTSLAELPKQNKEGAGISISDFEALKAKLEAAEQRIKNLEAEKHSVPLPQTPVWGQYPIPPHYTYPYSQGLPYPPAPITSPGYSNAPSGGAAANQVGGTVVPNDSIAAHAIHNEPGTQVLEKQRAQGPKSNHFKGFVAYTPKPQGPVLDSQKQDTQRSSTNVSNGQS